MAVTQLQVCVSPKTGHSPHHVITPLLAVPPAQDPQILMLHPPQQSPASVPLQRSHLPCPLDSRLICPAHSCDTSLSRGFLSFLR